MIDSFERTWDVARDREWQKRYRIFERDGWRRRVPGCSSRENLHAHHVVFRSSGGGDEDDTLVVRCAAHHQQGIHRGLIRCLGRADGLLRRDLGVGDGGPPIVSAVEDVLVVGVRDGRGPWDGPGLGGGRAPERDSSPAPGGLRRAWYYRGQRTTRRGHVG